MGLGGPSLRLSRRSGLPADLQRAAPLEALEGVTAPTEEEVQAIDLEAAVIDALAAAKDEMTRGADADHDALFALADRVVHGLGEAEIARAAGASRDAIARRLRRARDLVWRHLLGRELGPTLDERGLEVAVEVAREGVLCPSCRPALLERVSASRPREALSDLLDRFSAARTSLPSLDSPDGAEMRRAVELVLSS